MTMTGPVQGLMIGLLSGVSQAAGIMIGRHLGKEAYEEAYSDAKRLMLCGVVGSLILSSALLILGTPYVSIYRVDAQVQRTAYQILVAFALISPIKVQNMILGGGIIRSGGMTGYVMWIDMPQVYFILSLEEVVRFLLSLFIFRRRKWMRRL